MIVIDELKHSQVVQVHLPKNCDFFARFGYSQPSSGQYSGDEDIPDFSSKMQTNRDLDNELKNYIPPTE